jgi:hypothetical protein
MAFKFFKKFFPIKTKSLDEFVETIKRESCTLVTAEIVQIGKDVVFTASVGHIGIFEYSILLQASTPIDRKVVYKEVCQTRFGASRGFADMEERGKATLRALVTADARLKSIGKELPNITTNIIGPAGKFDKQLYQELYKDAKKYRIKPVKVPS